jgi:hypothetical protein
MLAGLLAMSLGGAAGVASASPLLTLQIEGSTTGAAGSYTTKLNNIAPGQTIFYEVNAIFAPGATNSNTANSPDGATDSIDSVPSFQLSTTSSGSTFSSGTMQNGFGGGTGSGVSQPNGTNTAVVRAVNGPGVYLNADSPLTLETGQLTLGTAAAQQLIGAYYTPLGNSGLTKVAGHSTAMTANSEESADPMIGYSPLAVNSVSTVPEPASLAVFSLGALALLRRRRTVA